MKPLHRRRWTHRLVGVAVLALWIAQWAALSHAVAHALPVTGSELAAEGHDGWGHAAATPSCALVDHLLVGHGAPLDSPAGVGPHPELERLAMQASLELGLTPSSYEARGPPWA